VVGPRNGCAGGGLPRGSRSHEDGSSKEERETVLQQISTGLPSGSQTGSVHILRQELLSKPSNSTSVPAWAGSKPELGLCKKMQSSIKAQICFLLKKCCTIASVAGECGSLAAPVGTGMCPTGLREVVGSLQGPGAGGAFFTLHLSRVVVLLEQSANQCGEALDAVTVMLEEVLEGSKGSANTFRPCGY